MLTKGNEMGVEKKYFPMYMDLSKKKVLFVGAGNIALRRIKSLADFCLEIAVIAQSIPKETKSEIQRLVDTGVITIQIKAFEREDIECGVDIVIAATDDAKTNAYVRECCKTISLSGQEILVNVVSDKELCDFYFPAIVQAKDVVIGIAGNGETHSKTKKVAEKIRAFIKSGERA